MQGGRIHICGRFVLSFGCRAALLIALFVVHLSSFVFPQQAANKRLVDFKADIMRSLKVEDGGQQQQAMNLVGNVVFYHNGAIITCDSAVRYSERRMECFGNVVINNNTLYAYGDRADYDGVTNIARIYAPIIKIVDKDAIMYTYDFAFNTQTNIGQYTTDATLKQNDSRFESKRGYYNTQTREMTGVKAVQIENPDYRIKSDSVIYNLDSEVSTFLSPSVIWKSGNDEEQILSADRGWYNAKTLRYFFTSNAYVLTKEQEIWADSMDYYSNDEKGIMHNNIQMRDEEQQIIGFGDYGIYFGNRQHAMLTKRPSLVSFDPQQKEDSLYMRSDSIFLYTIDKALAMKQDSLLKGLKQLFGEEEIVDTPPIASDSTVVAAQPDIVKEKPAKETKGFWAWLKGLFGGKDGKKESKRKTEIVEEVIVVDSLDTYVPTDSLFIPPVIMSDTLAADSVMVGLTESIETVSELLFQSPSEIVEEIEEEAPPVVVAPKPIPLEDQIPPSLDADSIVRTVKAYHNVKIFRNDFQAVCDSLISFSLDSTMHLYIDPVLWSDNNQIKSEVVDIYSVNQQIDKAVFTGEPIMSSEVDSTRYNQVKGKVIEAFFRDNEIFRTDVNGNGQTYYYMQDDETGDLQGFLVAECANISFHFADKQIESIVYKGNPVYTIYPMEKIPEDQPQTLPGFLWEANRRPLLSDVFDRYIRASEREHYEQMPLPDFPITRQIDTQREQLIKNRSWRDRNDRVSPEVYDFIRSLGYQVNDN